ncbi:MAG: Asp-tRNA(Asn)/Glu-tRNA(Gln) amidotransferase subunit GatB [Candidatus Dojkabacteria bacterium]
MKEYELVIGVEIHIELKTKSKMFCTCSAEYFASAPNANTCPICLGMPGTLPIPNKTAIDYAIKVARALQCSINTEFVFARKHYFYPDLPKGYQITQYHTPIGIQGTLAINAIDGSMKEFRITRVHIEEDTGKLMHDEGCSLIDYNRAGVPLLEIVTEPVFHSSDEVKTFLEHLHTVIKYLGVSDAEMEKGSMRLEPNISVREKGVKKLPEYKVEIKNINSFNFVKQAIEFEFQRQAGILEQGGLPDQETRGFQEKDRATFSQRKKEDAGGYRYFPEPDIPPIQYSREALEKIYATIPELHGEKQLRFVSQYLIKDSDAATLARTRVTADLFEDIVVTYMREKRKKYDDKDLPQKIANLIVNAKISLTQSREGILANIESYLAPAEVNTQDLEIVVRKVVEANREVFEEYKNGKESVKMFFIGQVKRALQGSGDPEEILRLVRGMF